jgi:hypothetical protein
MVKLTTKIVKSTDLWSKINLCTKSLILRKINDKSFQCENALTISAATQKGNQK